MIIDIHGHYTTEPQALQAFRDKQLAGIADAARKPASTDLGISDETLVKSVEPQLKLQKERGSDLTVFSPRASGMAHHVGTEEVGREWARVSNDLIHRICTAAGQPLPSASCREFRRADRALGPRARAPRERALGSSA
jgi:4-oxalmesaconate hydratase